MPKPSADRDTAKLQPQHASQVMRTFTRDEEDRDVSDDVGAAMQHVGADHPRIYLKQVLAGIIAAGVQSEVSRCARCERPIDSPVLALRGPHWARVRHHGWRSQCRASLWTAKFWAWIPTIQSFAAASDLGSKTATVYERCRDVDLQMLRTLVGVAVSERARTTLTRACMIRGIKGSSPSFRPPPVCSDANVLVHVDPTPMASESVGPH